MIDPEMQKQLIYKNTVTGTELWTIYFPDPIPPVRGDKQRIDIPDE